MNILFVSPKFIGTFWSWKYLLKFINKKAAFPPLGLLTVAAMLPKSWGKKLIDMNVSKLTHEDIKWADYVFVGAMMTQSESAEEVISSCRALGVPVVLGGPILEMGCEKFGSVSHFLLGEVENTLPEFLEDLQLGRAKKIYPAKNFPDLSTCPIPLWELINPKDYACLMVQYGRGCPFGCTFCNVAVINGRDPRVKPPDQFLDELDAIYGTGFRGPIIFADDNFIGNKNGVIEMLPGLIKWQQDHGYPFDFTVEADIRLADGYELMKSMVLAGFKKVFLGLETPNRASLDECGKRQNVLCQGEPRDMVASVKMIQRHGLHPMSGFIIGFDSDGPDIFKLHEEFYEATGIVFPMVGVLQAIPKTKLYDRLKQGGRLQGLPSGNNTDCEPNFNPKMGRDTLVVGYKRLMRTIYSPRNYYQRIRVFLGEYNAAIRVRRKVKMSDFKAFIASMWRIGLFGGLRTSYYYWKTLLLALFKYRRAFSEAVALQIYGVHFRKFSRT